MFKKQAERLGNVARIIPNLLDTHLKQEMDILDMVLDSGMITEEEAEELKSELLERASRETAAHIERLIVRAFDG
jgi:polyhydroxyalkanoate synthesis regulator phasin